MLEKYYLPNGEKFIPNDSTQDAMSISGSATSLYMTRFWGHDENLMYYVNHSYPLQAAGWGSTSDYILLEDGMEIDVAMFSDWDFYHTGAFAYFTSESTNSVDSGIYNIKTNENINLTMRGTATNAANDGSSTFVGEKMPGEDVVYCKQSQAVADYNNDNWKELSQETDDNGQITLTFDKPGTYYVSSTSTYENYKLSSGNACVAPPIAVINVSGENVSEETTENHPGEYDGRLIKNIEIKKMVILFLVGMMVCLSRNNGVYIVIPSMVCLTLYVQKERSRYVILLICLMVCYQGLEGYVAPQLGVEKGSVKEVLSIPFQQTARYIKEYPEEVTLKEKKAINDILSYDGIKENYNPEISDFVKNTFREGSEDKLDEYFKVWFEMFLKHPMVYIEATLNNTFSYYYPFYNEKVLGDYQFYIKGAPVATGYFDIHYITPVKIRTVLAEYAQIWKKVPGFSQLVDPGFYTWILLLLAGYLIYRKRTRDILLLIGPAINILICIASPVNGLLRYALPLMACTPLLIYLTVREEKESETEGENRPL